MHRIAVRHSPIHDRGVFAAATISARDRSIEYKVEFTSPKEAQRRHQRSAMEYGHTFFLNLDDGRMIDGEQGGNSARWINHSWAPNCKAEKVGDRIFIRATRRIEEGAKIFIDCVT